jgi:hypothetical protein
VSRRGLRGRRLGPPLRGLIVDDDDRIADLDLGVRDPPVGAGEAHPLGRLKHLGVELQGLGRALNNQAGRDTAVGVRERIGRACAHCCSFRLVACLRGVVDRMNRGRTAMPRLDTLTGRSPSSTSNMYRIAFLLHRPCVPS